MQQSTIYSPLEAAVEEAAMEAHAAHEEAVAAATQQKEEAVVAAEAMSDAESKQVAIYHAHQQHEAALQDAESTRELALVEAQHGAHNFTVRVLHTRAEHMKNETTMQAHAAHKEAVAIATRQK
jgi:hypothetical protein